MNTFYKIILPFIIIVIGYSIFQQMDNSTKLKRVSCQNETITFEKIFSIKEKENFSKARELLQSNNYTLTSDIEYSKYMKSNLISLLNKDQADEQLKKLISKYTLTNKISDEKININYYIYENDKEDKAKKGNKSKLYAGYLVFEFKYKNELLYKIQSDYMSIQAKDIQERMDCIIKSFLLIKK